MPIVKFLDRLIKFPDSMGKDQISMVMQEKAEEYKAKVDATTQAQPQPPKINTAKTGTIRRQKEDGSMPSEMEAALGTSLLSKDDLKATIMIESSGDPLAENKFGFKGLLQLGDDRAQELGVDDPFDPKQSIDGYMKHAEQARDKLTKNDINYDAVNAYILWQQGMTGGVDILKNTDSSIKGFKREKNMMNNLPPDKEFRQIQNPTVGDWIDGWRRVFERRKTAKLDIDEWLA